MPRRSERAPEKPAAKPGAKSPPKPVAKPRAKPGEKSVAESALATAGRDGHSTVLVSVVLALLLLMVGAAGYQAATLLQFAIAGSSGANATAASTAAYVCDALKRQDYQHLAQYIDPAPVPPAVTGAFDKQAIVARLNAFDVSQGRVLSCTYAPYGSGAIVSTDGATRYQLTLRRANAAGPANGTLALRQQSGGKGGWLIERDSSFLASHA